jgi:fucose 4-O-acetylase-like acetyltransferase
VASRLNWVDYAKGLVIWLVVYGHTLNSAANAGVEISETFRALCESTFCNVIPLFFFVSGLFVERSYDKRGAGPFVAERLLRLAYPYFIWSTIQMVAEITFAGHSARGTTIDALFAILYRPHAQFWFLYAMVWMFVAYALIRRAGLRWRVVLAATAVLLFVFPLPTNTMALDQFSRHFLFFAAGILASRYFVGQERLPNIPLWATALLTCVSVGSSLFIFTRLIEPALLVAGPHRYYYLYLGVLCGASVIGGRNGWRQPHACLRSL